MKLGNFLILLTLALVCLGFFINDSIHTHSELAKAQEAVTSLQNENNFLVQQTTQQAETIQDLQIRFNLLEQQNRTLASQNIELNSQIQVLTVDLQNLQTENETLRQITTQLASNTNSSLVKAILTLASLNVLSNNNNVLAAGFLPVFLVGGGILGYGAYLHKRNNSKRILEFD